jgi:peptidoglycan hydrolase-like protein with peptidoglycan-binding domain
LKRAGLLAVVIAASCLGTSSRVIAGNFEFVVPASPGLAMSVSGYDAAGTPMFEAVSATPEQRAEGHFYVVRIDEDIIRRTSLKRWCVIEQTGSWESLAAFPGAPGLCDEDPTEARGRYNFSADVPLALSAAVSSPKSVPVMDSAEAAECVQSALNDLGYDIGRVDGDIGRRTVNAGLVFAATQSRDFPALSGETAAVWCDLMTAMIETGDAKGPPNELGQFQYGPDIDVQTARHTQFGLAEIRDYFSTSLGGALKAPGTIFVSADANWLTESYLRHLKLGNSYRQGKLDGFTRCGGGEGGLGFTFMCARSDVFTGDWFGSGRQAQRTYALAHEYFHMLQYESVGTTDSSGLGPQWLIEGAAEYVAFRILADTGRMKGFDGEISWHTQKAGEVGSSLKQMETRKVFYSEPRASSSGMIAAHLLAQRAGLEALPRFYKLLGQGNSVKSAFEKSFRISLSEFYALYEKEVH